MNFISAHPHVCRRLFGKVYNTKTLFYLAYKTARLNGLDLSKLPLSIKQKKHTVDKYILWCDEDINNIIGEEHLKDWDFSTIQTLPLHMFSALQNLKEIPEWLDETMWVQFKWIYNESTVDEFDYFREQLVTHKTSIKQCVDCFNTFLGHASQEMSTIIKTDVSYVKPYDAEEIMSILQDMFYWCESCHCTPLFRLIQIKY